MKLPRQMQPWHLSEEGVVIVVLAQGLDEPFKQRGIECGCVWPPGHHKPLDASVGPLGNLFREQIAVDGVELTIDLNPAKASAGTDPLRVGEQASVGNRAQIQLQSGICHGDFEQQTNPGWGCRERCENGSQFTSLAGADANLTIHVVGYDVDTSAAAQLACIAEKGRGGYFTANDASGLNSALAEVNNTITRNEPLPEPVKEVKAPEVKATAKSLKIKIAGPGTVALKLAPWAKPPKYWKLLDAETGETIAETGKMELTVKPGTYQIAWRQVEHGAAEVQLPMVVTVKAGETQEVAVDTGIRMVPPEGLQRPYYYQLIADEGELDKPFRKREVAAYYWIWDPVPVPPGDYRLVLRQGEHGWSEADLGRIRIEPGKLNDVMLDQGLNLQWAEEWGADSLYYLKITSEEGREMLFAKRGPVILAPGKYKLTLRYKEHGWSESDWGEITVPEQGYADAGFTSGIRFLSDKKDPRHTIYAVNLDSEKEASITNNWGPFPLLPGRYRLEYQPEGGERFTVAEEIEIPAGTMVEAEM